MDTAVVYSSFSASGIATEESPLVARGENSGSKQLRFCDFLSLRLLSSVFLIATLSFILSAFETVRNDLFRLFAVQG